MADDEPYATPRTDRAMAALRDELGTALRARGIEPALPDPEIAADETFPATVVEWTCASLYDMAGQFLAAGILADVQGDAYHAEQYYHAGGAFYDAWRAQCPH